MGREQDTRFRVSEDVARDLVEQFGTPLYVVDEAHLRATARRYREAFASAYEKSELSFASKANSTLAIIHILRSEGCRIDVASEGEFRAALAAGVDPTDCVFHGNNKSLSELQFALSRGTGQIVIDNFHEIHLLISIRDMVAGGTTFLLRLAPGVDPITHHRISTGQEDSKFGFNISDGSAEAALLECLEAGLDVRGFHCHVGSQLLDPEAQQGGGEALGAFAAHMLDKHAFTTEIVNVGGGLGVRYMDEDRPMQVEDYCRAVVEPVQKGLGSSGLHPTIVQEPGRALVAESGVTLYQVGSVKTVPTQAGSRTYIAVDGGLADNPRPAMYDAEYTVERVAKCHVEIDPSTPTPLAHGGTMATLATDQIPLPTADCRLSTVDSTTVTVCGRHCETDNLFENIDLPGDLGPGDILQVLCTGAYNASMASNYNRYQRPATVLLTADGHAKLIQRRETYEEMFAREVLLGE